MIKENFNPQEFFLAIRSGKGTMENKETIKEVIKLLIMAKDRISEDAVSDYPDCLDVFKDIDSCINMLLDFLTE